MQGSLRRLPWQAPVWHPGNGGSVVVPDIVQGHVDLWHGVVLLGLPLLKPLLPYLREGGSLNEFRIASLRNPSIDSSYYVVVFEEVVFPNRIQPKQAEFSTLN